MSLRQGVSLVPDVLLCVGLLLQRPLDALVAVDAGLLGVLDGLLQLGVLLLLLVRSVDRFVDAELCTLALKVGCRRIGEDPVQCVVAKGVPVR
ncbi:hypothetical protein [Streptomyces violaceus]|uniref:Secreted protein n=1 Tax=Streptomyces violaceus TaxID=1936 RepID=A0ABZ1NMV5_STRVL